jgi:hypothetical protein
MLLLLRCPDFGEAEGFAFRGEAAENSLIIIGVELLRWGLTALGTAGFSGVLSATTALQEKCYFLYFNKLTRFTLRGDPS